MINIFAENETVFSSNGKATLEPMTCTLSMTINGAWVLNMECPYDIEGKWKEIIKGRIIQVTDINILRGCSTSQRYRIYDTTETLTSIKVIAFPVGMEATYDAIIEEIRLKSKTGNSAVAQLSTYLTNAGVTKYTLTASGLSTKARTVEYKDTNLIAVLCGQGDDSIVNKYNAEIAYNNYQIFIKDSIGSATNYDVRLGKNLTGLNYEVDDSAVVTRIYPLSSDGVRFNEFDTGLSGENHYIDSLDIELFPYTRAAFVTVPYDLIDTDVDALVKTDTIITTKSAYDNVYDYTSEDMEIVWGDICAYNQFTYTHEQVTETILMVPELLQSLIKDVSPTIADNVLTAKGVTHAGLKSWLTKAIRAGLDWIKEEDLPDKNWIQNQDNSYSYGNALRKLTNEWAKIDGKMSYFDANSKWVPEKDDLIAWDWVQKKGHNKKYGNNKRYCARNTYVYTMSTGGVFSQYWFDADGWWDEEGEESDWNWYQSGDKWWFGESDAGDNPSKYAHDTWLFIKSSNDASSSGGKPTLYYFGSDGFMVPSLSVVNIDWDWHQTKNKWYFGSTNTEYRAEYATEQWLYIDGDWYYFDENGYAVDIKVFPNAVIDILTDYLQYELVGDVIADQQNALYSLLYQLMEAYCNDLYADGLDKPLINVAIDFVDLSKTQEYASFSALETICLGDSVKVTYDTYGSYVEEEVVGLTYDCLKGCNTQITVGRASKTVSQMFDTSVKGADNGQRLVAGENVTITGNTINVSSQVGDVYAGDTVSVQQIQSTGTPIARISVNGVPTTIYAVGTDVQVNPIKQSGDKIATITVGGTAYDIYADTGLKYWVETETDIYREGVTNELIVTDDSFLVNEAGELLKTYMTTGIQKDIIYKANDTPCLCAVNTFYVNNERNMKRFYLVSPITPIDYHEGTEWTYKQGRDFDLTWETVENSAMKTPIEDADEFGSNYPRAKYTHTFSYNGSTWKVVSGNILWYPINSNSPGYIGTLPEIDTSNDPRGVNLSDVQVAQLIIDAAGATTTSPDAVGVSHNDHIFYYCPQFDNTNHDETKDLVYITKDGYVNAKGFMVDGEAVGSFYKTNLYLGTQYSSTITLSESYTKYDLLMIETYNQDDKKNLASTVNVSDLSNSSYVGVDGYLMYTITNGKTLTFHEAPSDTNHSRYIKAVYGLRTSHDSGEEPPLEDITIDGTSIVSGGVGVISLGNNLSFSNGFINATDTTYNDFAGSAHGLVPQVQTQAGKYLKDDGTWDEPEGTTVEANPSGTATATLSTIQIDDTIYEVVGGGGGGSRTLLYSGSTTTGTITLSDSYENYDYLYVVAYAVGEITALVDTDRLGYDISAFTLSECSGSSSASQSNADMYVELVVTNSTTLTIANPIGGIVIKKIYGISGIGGSGGASALEDLTDVNISSPTDGQILTYNSTSQKWENANAGSGGSGYSETVLYTGSSSQSSYQLSDNISNYDLVWIRTPRSNNFETGSIFPASYLIDSITTQKKIGIATDDKYTFFKVTNETTLTRQEENDLHIEKVVGIKIEGSGGGSSGGSNTLLFQGSSSSSTSQIVLDDDYTNYDLLIFRTARYADGVMYKTDKTFGVLGLATNDYIQDIGWSPDYNYWTYQIANSTTLNRIAQGSNFFLYEIYGVKL